MFEDLFLAWEYDNPRRAELLFMLPISFGIRA
jgi:hypothetical protein